MLSTYNKLFGFADPAGGINQIPGECTVSGDVRLTPFYE